MELGEVAVHMEYYNIIKSHLMKGPSAKRRTGEFGLRPICNNKNVSSCIA